MSTFKKYKFTNGNEFTFNGINYIGYYNVSGSNVFKTRFNQDNELVKVDNLNTSITTTDFYDRSVSTDLVLNNKLDDILFRPNELINKNSINFKIELLYDNFKSLFKYTKIQNPKVPFDFTKFIAITGTDGTATPKPLTAFTVASTNTIIASASLFNFSFSTFNPKFSASNIIIKGSLGNLATESTLFNFIDNTIFTFNLSSNNQTFSFINSSTKVGVFEDLEFKKIVSVDTGPLNKTLYISDSGNNSLFKVDVNSITNRDRNNSRRYLLTNVIGSSGTGDTNFNIIDKVTYGNDSVFVYDRGDKIIKEYSEEFNLLKIYKNFKFLNNNNLVDIKYDKVNDKLYALFDNFKILVIDGKNFNTLDEYIFDANIFESETPKKLLFSQNDSNIYYLITTKNVYKYFVNTKKLNIGKFLTDYNINFQITWEEVNIPPDTWSGLTHTSAITGRGSQEWNINNISHEFNIIDCDIINTGSGIDNFYILTHDGNLKHKLLIMEENNNDISFLINDNPNLITLNNLLINDEYFNNISYNNLIYKFLFNLNLLTNEIGRSLFVKYDNDFVILDSIKTVDINDKLIFGNITNEKDFYVGVNETASTKIFNRTLSNLYYYIENISKILNLKYRNIRIPPLSTITF